MTDKKWQPLTHAYVLWAANVLLAVFAPAFPLSLGRQEIRPQPAQAHSLGRWQQAEKKEADRLINENSPIFRDFQNINNKEYELST